LAIIGWTTNKSVALTSIARAKTNGTAASFESPPVASPRSEWQDVRYINADFHGRENNQSSDGCRGQW
jgi:hypothetical protein